MPKWMVQTEDDANTEVQEEVAKQEAEQEAKKKEQPVEEAAPKKRGGRRKNADPVVTEVDRLNIFLNIPILFRLGLKLLLLQLLLDAQDVQLVQQLIMPIQMLELLLLRLRMKNRVV